MHIDSPESRRKVENALIKRFVHQVELVTSDKERLDDKNIESFTYDELFCATWFERQILYGSIAGSITGVATLIAFRRYKPFRWIPFQSTKTTTTTTIGSAVGWIRDSSISVAVAGFVSLIPSYVSFGTLVSKIAKLPTVDSESQFANIYCPNLVSEYEKIQKEIEMQSTSERQMNAIEYLEDTNSVQWKEFCFTNPESPLLKATISFCKNCQKRMLRYGQNRESNGSVQE